MSGIESVRSARRPPRRFVGEDATLAAWPEIGAYFDALEKRELPGTPALEEWLYDWSELTAAVGEEMTARYVRMTCHTDDSGAEEAYLDYLQNVMPNMEKANFRMSGKFLACPHVPELPEQRYEVFVRARRNEVEIFRDENVPLQTEDDMLAQKYQKACGEMTVQLDGEELTLPQVAKRLEETDREVRRKAWTGATRRQLADREALEGIFDEMVRLRDQMARNAGFDNFIDYQFRRYGRFDYTPEHCREFHDAVESEVMPLFRKLREQRREQLGLDKLAPYDLSVDPAGRPPLRPFANAAELSDGTGKLFSAVDPVFDTEFSVLRDNALLDLESRKGKAPGGYQSTLDEVRLPFIFMNAAGRNTDVFTLLHEGGHAFHALATRNEPLLPYRSAPIEFCEVASMGMEMMASERLGAFYPPADAARARRARLEEVIEILPWIARVDAMQHWMYTNPGHTRREREAHWLALDERFNTPIDWSEIPEWRGCSWYSKLHFFCVPLYYIEYGIAQCGALQLWCRYLDDPQQAVADYRKAMALGGSRPLPELFAAAGLRFAFDASSIAPLVRRLEAEICD